MIETYSTYYTYSTYLRAARKALDESEKLTTQNDWKGAAFAAYAARVACQDLENTLAREKA